MIALLPRLLSIVTRELADKSVFVPVLPNPSGISAPKEAPRGTKRSRSPEQLENIPLSGGPDDGMWCPRTRLAACVGTWRPKHPSSGDFVKQG